jgi:site-specific DNA-methyltransferase (adenine-specific)
MIELLNIDCMEFMSGCRDKQFDLAIVDPPYGIGNFIPQTGKVAANNFNVVEWNNYIPSADYFNELKRISVNRIIWGANYYNCFESGNGAIVWDKCNMNTKLSRCEIASQTFYKTVNYFKYPWGGINNLDKRDNIHPCEKPIQLYKWLLKNYAKPGDKILDTHLGSGSSAIAAYDGGFDFVGCEIDKEYFEAAKKRFEKHKTLPKPLFKESEIQSKNPKLF